MEKLKRAPPVSWASFWLFSHPEGVYLPISSSPFVFRRALLFVRACCRRASSAVSGIAVPQAQQSTTNQPTQSRKASACRSECHNASKQTESIYCIAVPQAQHSTAQSARTKPPSKYVPLRVRQRKQANRVGESQHKVVEYVYNTLRSQNERRNQNLPGLQKYATINNYSHSAGLTREGLAFSFDLNRIQHCSFLRPFYVFRTRVRHPGCYPGAWRSGHLQVVGCT